MSHSLLGKDVDDILVEFYGPHSRRNYFEGPPAPVVPQLSIQVFGADPLDEVTIEKNTTLEIIGTNNSNAIGSKPVRGGKLEPTRTPADWVALGTAAVGDGLVVIALPVEDQKHGIRVRVTTKTLGRLGDGGVEVVTQWH
jgi:hypothetical protein